jgi:hypothetical protein
MENRTVAKSYFMLTKRKTPTQEHFEQIGNSKKKRRVEEPEN